MFSTLRTRFGIPGVISVIALVFAMLGGAYAASNSSGGGKATTSAKAKKGPRGPKGATGPAGPAGAQGPAGAAGKDGAAGGQGPQGNPGSAGNPGKSVEVASYSGPECAGSEEGATVQVAGEPATKKYVCDGEEGPQGTTGSPWTLNNTLPVGATETGSWAVSGPKGEYGTTFEKPVAPISFTVKLAAAIPGAKRIYVGSESNPDPTHCPGSAGDPQAASGYLCVYETFAVDIGGPGFVNSTVAGVLVGFNQVAEAANGPMAAFGTWAVTG